MGILAFDTAAVLSCNIRCLRMTSSRRREDSLR